jgi:hypothetical protein
LERKYRLGVATLFYLNVGNGTNYSAGKTNRSATVGVRNRVTVQGALIQ